MSCFEQFSTYEPIITEELDPEFEAVIEHLEKVVVEQKVHQIGLSIHVTHED
jgi:hypothetical protein